MCDFRYVCSVDRHEVFWSSAALGTKRCLVSCRLWMVWAPSHFKKILSMRYFRSSSQIFASKITPSPKIVTSCVYALRISRANSAHCDLSDASMCIQYWAIGPNISAGLLLDVGGGSGGSWNAADATLPVHSTAAVNPLPFATSYLLISTSPLCDCSRSFPCCLAL
ncbi:hypothetical protein CPB86DRAFT_878808, partial [Serendipita vermifera]